MLRLVWRICLWILGFEELIVMLCKKVPFTNKGIELGSWVALRSWPLSPCSHDVFLVIETALFMISACRFVVDSHQFFLSYCSNQNTTLSTIQQQQQQQLQQQQQQLLLQNQLQILANSPFGDSPLFRNSLAVRGYLIYI